MIKSNFMFFPVILYNISFNLFLYKLIYYHDLYIHIYSNSMDRLKEYSFLEILGQGAFSTVYHVKTKASLEDYAIKVIRKKRINTKKHQKSLESEIDIQRSLKHPNIVQLFDYFEDDENFYLLLEYNPGVDLRQVINRDGKFPESSCKLIFQQLVEAISYLQASGIMHRDLKLANILLYKSKPQITDFGLAVKLDESQGFRETFCGTPNYISP
jgi:serine/threonine protein kinase